ncbi:MAG TPA: [Fe-S]-binding protein [Spirochaetota bacterium]|nr:[Fe-S]-binding protein [Spirochaetota bacterium]HPV42234.1 [Fe-S]-binding protein [Spirochaetota bacterium]
MTKKRPSGSAGIVPPAASFFLSAAIMAAARVKAPFPVLMVDRLMPGSGWIEIAALSAYAAWLTAAMVRAASTSRIRLALWTAFSLAFFAQALLGFAGFDIFFMTGRLHVPVPAVIIGGPLYRGGGLFMPILFVAALVAAGPAWCSHLCYFGAWDNRCAAAKNKPGARRPWMSITRVITLAATAALALVLRYYGASPYLAAAAAVAFGAAGIAIMVFVSRKRGVMVHCLAWCPLGLAANIIGRLSPFRIRIDGSCTECGACRQACRYGALEQDDIRGRKPGFTCSLCGDCIASCSKGSIGYRFLRLGPDAARVLFIVVVVSLHASFLGLARL